MNINRNWLLMNVNCQTNDLIFSSSMLKTLYCKLVFYDVLRAVHNVDSSYYTLYSMHTTRTVSYIDVFIAICQPASLLLALAAPPNQSSIYRGCPNSFISRCIVSTYASTSVSSRGAEIHSYSMYVLDGAIPLL